MSTVEQGGGLATLVRNVHAYFALLVPATLLGFWKTYFAILNNLPDAITPAIHVHAVLMLLWLAMLIAQAWFIRTNRFRPHQWVGRMSYVLAPVIIWAGLIVLHEVLNRTPGGVTTEAAQINVLAFGQMLAFGATWGLAIAYRRQTPLHVRFIISTAFAIATGIVFRIFTHWVPGFGTSDAAIVGNFSVLGTLLIVLIARDWRLGMRRSPFWVVTVLLSGMHLGFWTFAKTDGWLRFCQSYADLPSWLLFNSPFS